MIQHLVKETINNFPSLLAWCFRDTNTIEVIDLDTKQSYASFKGVYISYRGRIQNLKLFEPEIVIIFLDVSWTHVKEIPNTKLLVSLHHNAGTLANMAVYDISKKGQIHEIYSLGEVKGGILKLFSFLRFNNYIFL